MTRRKVGDVAVRARSRVPRRIAVLLLAAAAMAGAARSGLRAATVVSTWTGAVDGRWSNAGNWSPGAADPSNGNGGVSDYAVIINAVSGEATAPTLDVTATVDSLTLTANATLSLEAVTLTLTNPALVNSGTMTLLGNSTIGTSTLALPGTGTTLLTGGGTLVLSNGTYSRISGASLTNVDNTIQGAGTITAAVTNQATILAEGGTLLLNSAIDNTAGTVSAAANGTLSISGALTGGMITAAAGGQITGSGTLANVTLTAASVWGIPGGASSPTLTGTFTNNSTVTILGDAVTGIATLAISGSGTTILTGGGTVTLSNNTYSRISGANLTNVDNTIEGAGTITAAVTNQASILAEGGILSLNGNVDNTAGAIGIAANGTLSVGATLTGGAITAAAGAQIVGGGTLANVTLTAASVWRIPSGAYSPTLSGTFTNNGTVMILGNGTTGTATLSLPSTGTVTLNGGGTVTLANGTYSRISNGNLTNVDNTIEGAGTIASAVVNQATILAEGGTLSLNGAVDNTIGTVSIAADGTLSIGGTLTGGSVTASAGAQLAGSGTLASATISGALAVAAGQFSNVTLAPSALLNVQPGSLQLSGTFTNHGTVTLLGNGAVGSATINLPSNGTVTLNGGGTVVLTNNIYSRISGGNLTNVDNTIQGVGTISSAVTNQATILADGGTLSLNGAVDNTAGVINVAANATLAVNSTLAGGTLSIDPDAQMIGSGTLANITLSNASVWNISSGSPTLAGTLTNTGAVVLLGNGSVGSATLTLSNNGTVTLNGGGTLTLTNGTYSRIGSGNLTNIDNTIEGVGTISAALTNQGTILAQGGTLTLNSGVAGGGKTNIALGAALSVTNFTQGALTNNGSFTMTGNGTVGTIDGAGAITLQSGAHLVLAPDSAASSQSSLAISSLNALDITDNKLIIQSNPAAIAVAFPALQSAVVSGRITSSTLPADLGIAVIDNGALASPLAFFGGVAVTGNSVLIAPELLGDTNIDGTVDLNDLNAVLNHLGQTSANWTDGNFDGAATIDLNDLNDVLNHLGVTYANASAGLQISGGQPTTTPEPASVFMIAGAALPALLRRRRKTLR